MRGGRGRGPTFEVGRQGEARAVAYLVDRGYAIVARNWRCRIGELDVVARDGDTLAFVEIRSRADATRGDAIATVGAAKQRKLAQVAAAYLASARPVARACRFDVDGLTGDDVVLIKDAFRVS